MYFSFVRWCDMHDINGKTCFFFAMIACPGISRYGRSMRNWGSTPNWRNHAASSNMSRSHLSQRNRTFSKSFPYRLTWMQWRAGGQTPGHHISSSWSIIMLEGIQSHAPVVFFYRPTILISGRGQLLHAAGEFRRWSAGENVCCRWWGDNMIGNQFV